MRLINKLAVTVICAMMVTIALPAAVAYHGDAPPASVDPVGGAYAVGIVPGGRQEMPGDPTVAQGGDNDLAEANGYTTPPSDGGGLQNLRSDAQYWCGSGYPVGTVNGDGLVVKGADPANQTGPKGYYEFDALWVYDSEPVAQAVDDHLIASQTGGEDAPGPAPYYYGAMVFVGEEEKPQFFTPGINRPVVFTYCVEADTGIAHPTNILPQNYTWTELPDANGDGATEWVRESTGATRGLFGYDDVFEWTSASRFGEDFREWTYYGDCEDGLQIWDPSNTRTCDAYPGVVVLDSAWYYGNGFIQTDTAMTQELTYRFTVNPSQTVRYPGYYNSLYQTPDMACVFGGGDGLFGNCGESFWVSQTRFPDVATSTSQPAPVLEDVDIMGHMPGYQTVHPAYMEANADWRAAYNCYFSPTCPITGGASPSATPAREIEPNHPEDPEERSALDASLNPTQNVSKSGWALYLDVYKWTSTTPGGGLNFDPIYGLSGGNYTLECSYTDDRPNAPGPGEPCNRRDIYPTGFWLEAMFGFARDHASNAQPDGEIDQRFDEEWVGLPDITRDARNMDPLNVADVGLVGGGNDVALDLPGGKVIQLKESCNLAVDNNVGSGEQNVFAPATTDLSGGTGANGAASYTPAVLDVAYGTPVPASREDISECNANGDATAGWGTFVGCEDPTWERGCAGTYESTIVYITPDGLAGLARTEVSARLIVPDGGLAQQIKGFKEHPLIGTLQPGTYELTDVDYYGGKI